jgi:hypothetical protein
VACVLFLATSAFAQTTRTVTAAWDANTDAVTRGYMLYYGTASGNYQWSVDAGTQTSTQLTLNTESIYYFVVRAYDASANLGPASTEATYDLRTAAPTASITATLQGTNALVTWSTTNAVSATINGTAVALSGSTSVPVTATTTFTIVATNSAGATVTRSATVTVTVPAPTATLTATMQGSTSALVTWSTSNATSATLNGAAVTLSGSQSFPVSATTTFTLLAVNAAGASVTKTATVTPPTTGLPSAPTGMSSLVSGNLVRLAWQAATTGAAPTGYRLYAGTRSGSSNLVNGAAVGNVLSVTGNLARGHYFARVRAENAAGLSPVSNETNFWVGKKVVSPTNLVVSWTGSTANFTWTQPAADSADSETPGAYVLEAGLNPGDTFVSVPTGASTSFSVPVPSGTYYVRVRGISDGAESDATQEVVLTPPGAPGAPSALTATGSAATLTLRWQEPTTGGAPTAYQLEAGSAPGLADIAVVQIGNIRSFSTPIPPGVYYIRVRAVNDRGTSSASNEVVVRR